MNQKPKCIIVSGRPGSGKTTLAGELSSRLYLPKLSRDEIKEGYVNTFGVKHDQLSKDTNARVNEVFFETVLHLLRGNVSLVIEAAFQHKNWNLVVPQIQEIAQAYVLICDPGAEASARRHLERGLKDPNREFFHGDKRVSIYRETGHFAFNPDGTFDAPHFDVPTLRVSTSDGYEPKLETIEEFIWHLPNKADAARSQEDDKMKETIIAALVLVFCLSGLVQGGEMNTGTNRVNYGRPFEPTPRPSLIPLPPGAVEPQGGLRDWCLAARDGYTEHMEEYHVAFKQAWAADYKMTRIK